MTHSRTDMTTYTDAITSNKSGETIDKIMIDPKPSGLDNFQLRMQQFNNLQCVYDISIMFPTCPFQQAYIINDLPLSNSRSY